MDYKTYVDGEDMIRDVLIGKLLEALLPIVGILERINEEAEKPIGIRVIGLKMENMFVNTFFN